MNAPPRRSSVGCLGCTTMLLLLCCTPIQVGLLWWLDPAWLDRMAFWRPTPFERDVLFVDSPEARQAADRELAAELERALPRVEPAKVELLSVGRLTAAYEPSRGAVLESPNGARLDVPAGAIRGRSDISMTPAISVPASMAASFAGPVYDIRVGSAERYDFASPPLLTLPFVPGAAPGEPTLAVWEGDRWVEVPSTVDRQRNTVTGAIPHASLLGMLTKPLTGGQIIRIGGGAVSVIAFLATTETGRGALLAAWFARSEEYETPEGNFKVHYYTSGENAVVPDAQYPLASGRPPGEHPLYVLDLGRWLEECREGLTNRGAPIAAARLIRWDVYLVKMEPGGLTPLGGPILLNSRLTDEAQQSGLNPSHVMRGTVVHELFHVAQDNWFNMVDAHWAGWWLEMTGAYTEDWYWQWSGERFDNVRREYLVNPRLPAVPMDKSTDPDYYAYASFLEWLDERHGNAVPFMMAVMAGGSASLASIDGVARERYDGKGLADLFTEWAWDFYHDDLWRGTLYPRLHQGIAAPVQAGAQGIGDSEFTFVTRVRGGGELLADHWAMDAVMRIPHLSAHPMYFCVNGVPAKLKPKLVVMLEPASGSLSPEVRALVATDRVGDGRLPAGGRPSAAQEIPLGGERILHVVEGLGGRGPDRVTLVLLNRSLTEDSVGFHVSRWLLLAPEWVQFSREGEDPESRRRWSVRWPRAELKSYPMVFSGYNVYRRKAGQPDSAFELVVSNEQDQFYIDQRYDDEEYVYTVRVLDKYGNTSEPATVENEDPWVGTWDGEVALAEGSFAEPLMAWLRKRENESYEEAMQEAAGIADAQNRAQRQAEIRRSRDEANEMIRKAEEWVKKFEELTRVGIPIQLRIVSREGRYYVTCTKILWQPLEQEEGEEGDLMNRSGSHSLVQDRQEEGFPRLVLRLHRPNEIRESEFRFDVKIDERPHNFSIKWVLRRGQP